MFGEHFLSRLCWTLCAIGLSLGWLSPSSFAMKPERQAPSTTIGQILESLLTGSARQSVPPTTPFLRIETGMHTAPIVRIDVDAAERYLVTASDDKTARVWDLATGKLLQVLRPLLGPGNEGKLYSVAISPDGRTVAAGGFTGPQGGTFNIYIFDQDSGKLTRRIAGLPEVINHLTYSPDGHYLAAALGGKNGIRVYATGDWAEVGRDTEYGDGSYF